LSNAVLIKRYLKNGLWERVASSTFPGLKSGLPPLLPAQVFEQPRHLGFSIRVHPDDENDSHKIRHKFFKRLRHIELATNTLSGENSSSILPRHSIRNNKMYVSRLISSLLSIDYRIHSAATSDLDRLTPR